MHLTCVSVYGSSAVQIRNSAFAVSQCLETDHLRHQYWYNILANDSNPPTTLPTPPHPTTTRPSCFSRHRSSATTTTTTTTTTKTAPSHITFRGLISRWRLDRCLLISSDTYWSSCVQELTRPRPSQNGRRGFNIWWSVSTASGQTARICRFAPELASASWVVARLFSRWRLGAAWLLRGSSRNILIYAGLASLLVQRESFPWLIS